ncbi:MAG TPA: hypothetical protein VIM97_02565 [Actinomycetes bacterium]|jgi:hypothetical protein
MAVSGGRLYIGGTFKTVNAVARTGTVDVDKFDITPDGSRLIAIGNWTSVAGLRRDQIVMLDLAASPVAVTGWSTTPLPAAVRRGVRHVHARRRRLARRQLLHGS